jgi:type IV secretory pathway VirB3-like protein
MNVSELCFSPSLSEPNYSQWTGCIFIWMKSLWVRVIGSVVDVAFQIIFCVEMHVNNFFYFLKIIFDISTSKRSKTYKPY